MSTLKRLFTTGVDEHRWRWVDPPLTVESILRASALVLAIAALANTLLVAVSSKDGVYQWTISIMAGFVAGGFIDRLMSSKLEPRHMWAALLSCVLWISNFIVVATAWHLDGWYRMRNGGFYLAFAAGSIFLYLFQRIVVDTVLTNQKGVKLGDDT